MARFKKIGQRYEIKFKRDGKQRKYSVPANTSKRALMELEQKMNLAFHERRWNPALESWPAFIGEPQAPSVDPAYLPSHVGEAVWQMQSRFFSIVKEDIMPSTYASYETNLNGFLREAKLLNRPARKLTTEVVTQAFEGWKERNGWSDSHVNLVATVLRKFLAFVEHETGNRVELRKRPSFRMKRKVRGRSFNKIKYISHTTLQDVLDHIRAQSPLNNPNFFKTRGVFTGVTWRQYNELLCACLELLFYQTMRYVEFSRLTWEDIDLKARTITLIGKGEKVRRVPITPKAYDALLTLHPCKDRIFSDFGYARLKNPLNKILKDRYGMQGRVGTHVLRHGGATYLLNKGMPLKELSEFMGHSSITQTEAYAKILSSRLRDVVQQYG